MRPTGQFVAGEPIEKCVAPGPLNDVFGKGGGVDQANTLADGASPLRPHIATSHRAESCGVVVKVQSSSGPNSLGVPSR